MSELSDVILGKVQGVDTGNVTIIVENESILNNVQVNQIVQIRSTKTGEKIIGLISKISRKAISDKLTDDEPQMLLENILKVNLVGTLLTKEGVEKNIFKRTLDTVPSVNADCFLLEGKELSSFMSTISSSSENPLCIGKYSISEESDVNLDGNKFFQRHAVIVGGTGSGKSWTVANILEKSSKLKSVNNIIFDLHGEYKPLAELNNTTLLKIAGPSDTNASDSVVFLPYWLLSYEEIESMLLDRTDSNAPNQSRALFDLIAKLKKEKLEEEKQEDVLNNFTIESPVPYDLQSLIAELTFKDVDEKQPGAKKDTFKAGALNGKLTRFIQRLQSKTQDKRLNFMFNSSAELLEYNWFNSLVDKLLNFGNGSGMKIIDFSEVPSDILPLITGLIGRLIFTLQQWTDEDKRHPIAVFCDEAHLYLPSNPKSGFDEKGLQNFERIAKEGRKYGVALVVISQRPSDVNKTILSQCGNFIAMRLTNPDDQNVIKRLFPDNLGDFSNLLPILDVGEALIVGDASLLPSRVKISKPTIQPNSATINFWDEWNIEKESVDLDSVVNSFRKQSKN
jgi:hypothetical protein